MLETRRVVLGPLVQFSPIIAHFYLTKTCAWWILKSRIPRCIVCVAHDVLAKLVQAMQDMYQGNALRPSMMEVRD